MKTLLSVAAVLAAVTPAAAAEDPYLTYVKTAPEFQRVRQDPKMMIGRWDTWVYMPWRFRWHIGTGERGGRFCREYGFNGGFTDHGSGPLEWLERWNLRFYNDHTAGKGYLYLHRANWKRIQTNPRTIRFGARGPRPLNAALLATMKELVTQRVNHIKQSPVRVAYALDDEISWGSFVKPIPWRIHGDDADYQSWLHRYYGGKGPKAQFVTPEFTRKQLGRPLKDIDFSPFLDRMTYNDSYWANLLGELVETANAADPDTPCGFVGGQAPNLFGGYDYAKLCRKIQFIEAYNIGSSQAVIRSLNPQNAMPQVTTHFHKGSRGTANDIWQTWYYLAHGNRGMIGWVEGWFERDGTPLPWLAEFSPTLKEVTRLGAKVVGARWVHDGVALYYSHPSIQVSWCLDIEPHGRTWVNRNGDHRLGTSHLVRKAWERLLTDSGIQYSFIDYVTVIQDGVPDEYKVLILPACYALSDIEAERIREFADRGGTVIADFACGLFDQHGKGRARGALDDLFGVTHDGTETKKDFFGGKLWVETNQDRGYSYKRYADLFKTVTCKLHDGYAIAERKLDTQTVRKVGEGAAAYLNLSPQRYLQYREEGAATPARRKPFIQPVLDAGVKPWITVTSPDGTRPRNCEVTYWRKGDRVYCFILQNAAVTGSAVGGGGVEGLLKQKTRITVTFAAPVRALRDERAAKPHGDGKAFTFAFNPVEAVFLSFRPPSTR
ncbi:MAG: beta-galactosidase trimerization domain-containing protein [Planctomycetota bacterium]